MKRIFFVFILVFILSACGSEAGENTVKPAELSDREEVMMKTLANTSFIFDYDLASDVSEVRVWAEKYEAGKLVDEHMVDLMTETSESKGWVVIGTVQGDSEEKIQQHHIGIGDKSGHGSTILREALSEEVSEMMSVWGDLEESRSFATGEEIILATVAHTSADASISSISSEFYEGAEVDREKLAEYDFVYVYKMMVE